MARNFIALLPLVLSLAGCSALSHPPEVAAEAAPIGVNTVAAVIQQWPSTYEATGTVRARSATVISAKWMGYVREVKVQVGDRVSQGQLLVVLDARDLDASSNRAAAAREQVRNGIPEADTAIVAAKASFDLAQSTFRRMNELYGKKSISDQEFDEASARLKSAQAALDMARARRSQLDSQLALAEQDLRATEVTRTYAELTAPSAGIVTAKSVESGTLAVPGTPLLTIEGGGYRLEASVEESRLSALRAGQTVSVLLDGADCAVNARVSEIVPEVDAASRVNIVKIDLPGSPGLRSGIFGRASFQSASRAVLSIPAAAVMERGQLQSVYVEDGGVAHIRLITLGNRSGDQVEALSGLNPADKVIFPIPRELHDGARVEVRP